MPKEPILSPGWLKLSCGGVNAERHIIGDAGFLQSFLCFFYAALVFAGHALEAADAVVLRLLEVLLHPQNLAVAILQLGGCLEQGQIGFLEFVLKTLENLRWRFDLWQCDPLPAAADQASDQQFRAQEANIPRVSGLGILSLRKAVVQSRGQPRSRLSTTPSMDAQMAKIQMREITQANRWE